MNVSKPNLPNPAARLLDFEEYRKEPHPVLPELKLDSNEGAAPDPGIIRSVLQEVVAWNRYPSTRELEAVLAERYDVKPEQVLVTAGADEALDRICRAYLQPGRSALAHWPSFEMIPRYVALAGGEFRSLPWLKGSFPVAEFQQEAGPDSTLLFVVSPNNPTGLGVDEEVITQLSQCCPDSLLVLDQAYAEFDTTDLTPSILAAPNGLLLRSFSKAWGLAGLRIGYAIAAEPVITNLRKAGSPYSVSSSSIAIALACLQDSTAWLERSVPQVQTERELLRQDLTGLGFEVCESRGNFILARGGQAEWLASGLASLGIAVRSFPAEETLRDSLRITCPASATHLDRLRSAISTCLRPQGILFDLDGVLADVSKSYRLAIQATAASWGLDLEMAVISSAKSEADSNNDWVLTQRLLARAGKKLSLEDVTARFESFYQGEGEQLGFRANEGLAVSADLLARLSERYPLAIVTGRPRRDAERFLEEQDIRQFFGAVLCMEDGPPKPDPQIVQLALGHLDIDGAWLLGDFPDDLTAARRAGVLPIGVVPRGSDPRLSRQALLSAGATSVLSETDELEKLLP